MAQFEGINFYVRPTLTRLGCSRDCSLLPLPPFSLPRGQFSRNRMWENTKEKSKEKTEKKEKLGTEKEIRVKREEVSFLSFFPVKLSTVVFFPSNLTTPLLYTPTFSCPPHMGWVYVPPQSPRGV